MNNTGWNMYVFRDGRRTVSGSELIDSLSRALRRWSQALAQDRRDSVLHALIAAGEAECALWDGAESGTVSAGSCRLASEITDSLAGAFLTGCRDSHSSILEIAERLQISAASDSAECVATAFKVAVQEGFAYYALHPRKVAMLLDNMVLKPQMAVVGIRSIGVTLSAVACASLRLRGLQCERTTVRPTGHPYDRRLDSTAELREWIVRSRDAEFLIVDEGPGISGSSFLAVAETLASHGIADERIHMVGSREVDPVTLRAENARERWSRYHFHVMQNEPLTPPTAETNLSGGVWRSHFQRLGSIVPASWASLEPAKFLARDQRSIFKFEGLGCYGEAVGERSKLLDSNGFSPRYLGNFDGFGQYEFVPGRALELRDLSPELVERMAEYLAFRATAFASNTPQTPELEKMLRWNWQVEFEEELTEDESRLQDERVVVCDGRMMPQEWLRSDSGELLKLDSGLHGDNHFFPGPCDIAWDVAGVIVEWELRSEARERFVREYERRSGDPVSDRLEAFLLAYTIFRLGWSKMAAAAMQGEYDEALLQRDYERYRRIAMQLRHGQLSREQRSGALSGGAAQK